VLPCASDVLGFHAYLYYLTFLNWCEIPQLNSIDA
jgi:hypothetical protein